MKNKFNKYIFYPDLANKFLLKNVYNIVAFKPFEVIFKTVFTNLYTYNPTALKALLLMESIYPKRCLINSRLIILRFTKTRCHSTIWLTLSYDEVIPFFSYYIKKPITIYSAVHSSQKESKYFIYPGLINEVKVPSWERFVAFCFKAPQKHLYHLFFYKAAFFD